MWPAAAAAESINGYIVAIGEAVILDAGDENADDPVITEAGCNVELKDDILFWCWYEKFELVPEDKFEFVEDNDEFEAMDGDGEQPVDPELAFQHIIIIL